MNAQYSVKPKADRDLRLYANYLDTNANMDVALRFIDSAHRTFSLLATQPKMGWRSRIRLRGMQGLRLFCVPGFADRLILYRPILTGVEILRVIPGVSRIRELLRREGFE